jgi:hypothetical protein
MTNDTIIFLGMDSHKELCEIAYACDERTAQAKQYGRIKTTKAAIVSRGLRLN